MEESASSGQLGLGWMLAITGLFVALNGFFVAAEFALVKVRVTRIEARAKQGDRRAQAVKWILQNLNRYLSACQLGITIASLVLGSLAEPAVARLIIETAARVGVVVPDSGALHLVALGLALSVVTILHMTIGEQAPKIWAIHEAEKIALITAYPLKMFYVVFRPFIWLVDVISNALLRAVGQNAADAHDEAEDVDGLRAMFAAASRAGKISSRQRAFGENILGLMQLQVRHIMLARVDIVYLSTSKTQEANLEIIKSSNHSRFPYGDPDVDHVLGIVHSRDVVRCLIAGREIDLKALARPFASVPDTQPISRLILDMQAGQTHSALVVDEHGTTVGMVFLEDALEEIVGPIHDEFDKKAPWVETKEGVLEMAGGVSLPEAADALGLDLGTEDDTIGGFLISRLDRMPVEGDRVDLDGYRAEVLAMSRRRVARVRFTRVVPGSAESGHAGVTSP